MFSRGSSTLNNYLQNSSANEMEWEVLKKFYALCPRFRWRKFCPVRWTFCKIFHLVKKQENLYKYATAPTTHTFLHANTQSSPFLHCTCPNHLNLPHLTTSEYPKDYTKPHFAFYFFLNDTVHPSHHHTPRSLQTSSTMFQSHIPTHFRVWTQALNIFPFMWCNVNVTDTILWQGHHDRSK